PQDLIDSGSLAEVRGIGPGLAGAIAEIVQTGKLQQHEDLRSEVPPGLLDLFRVGGLGAKKIRALHQELGVGSLADLERACREGRVAALAGFGAKSQARILEALAHLLEYGQRHLISEASTVASRLLVHLRENRRVRRAETAGSLRRWRETVGDLDFVAAVAATDREGVARHFESALGVDHLLAAGDTKVSVLLAGGFQADLRMVEEVEFPAALHHFTGSKEHNVLIRGRAKRDGLTVNEYGLFRGEERLPVASEEALYRALGLEWIPPELREGLDEIELAETRRLPSLLDLGELVGTFHVHTTWSDGTATLQQMAEACRDRGWRYLGIADHSKLAAYARGLSPDQVRAQWREIESWNASEIGVHLFRGTECDVLADGTLDFEDSLLVDFDFVVASVHSRFGLPRQQMTDRLVRAVSHPAVTFLGHPTGRLLLAREGYDVDLDAVLDAAFAHGVIVEVNANPHRLDLDWRVLRGWLRRGGLTAINPDAHSTAGLADVEYGVGIARKAGASPEQVLNAWPLERVREHFAARRREACERLGQSAE
ncbi:MAG: DNA polymerase/3'-5' exonuclease PolX, partial [Thermoanaerobaculia bacterium]|nr:DNA polymerase/3'-5' exonuclease PolX [Thermoanaerobaculia bacterium]